MDKYSSFRDLASATQRGVDYEITYRPVQNSAILIVAPHAGKIERGTSELAVAIAGHAFSLYLFEGLRASGNRDLHVTSHHFDEPNALKLAAESKFVLGIHGRMNRQDRQTTMIGGLHSRMKRSLASSLIEAGYHASTSGHNFPAKHPMNICNRGTERAGAQLELPLSLRDRLNSNKSEMRKYVFAIRNAIKGTWL